MSELTCIVCPLGCRIKVENTSAGLNISGHGCPRGEAYARDETVAPKRVLTGVVALKNKTGMLPVKTAGPIPKELIFLAMDEIRAITLQPPVTVGQVIRENLAGTGIALVATKSVK